MNVDNHDRSDLQSDYHDVGWWIEIRLGSYEKPYQVQLAAATRHDEAPAGA